MNGYTLGFLLVIIAMIISMIAQAKVNGAYSKYSKIESYTGMTGYQVARRMLDQHGLSHVAIREVKGTLSDHYDPRNETVNLSRDVYYGSSIASVAVACHECGHALQHAEGYRSLIIRNALIPFFNVSQQLGYLAIFIGFFFGSYDLAMIGVILICGILIYQLLTLPVEFNASSRALHYLDEGVLVQGETLDGARSMLSAAAFTYVASMLSSLASILRLVLILGGGRRRD